MLFLAAGDRGSATVQWLRMPESERHAGDGLTDMMVDIIMRKDKPPNEIYAIGAVLAARLGLERIHLVDDHIADGPNDPDYDKAMGALFGAEPKPAALVEYQRRQASLHSASDLMGYYRWLNEPETQRASIAADMGRAAREPSAGHQGRQYVSWWENRNLRMVANIRRAFAAKPDARVLVIVGSAHKGYFDAYLDMMQDVRLIDAMPFLK
jgi:hypothetical protein